MKSRKIDKATKQKAVAPTANISTMPSADAQRPNVTHSQSTNSLQDTILQVMRQCVLFQPLNQRILNNILQSGSTVTLKPEEVLSEKLVTHGFVHVVLHGEIKVARQSVDQTLVPTVVSEGKAFGPIDEVFGRGKYRDAQAVSDVTLLVIKQDILKKLMKRYPELADQLSYHKLVTALNVAIEHQKSIDKKASKDSPEVRVYPRLSTFEKEIFAQFSPETKNKVVNVSISGLAVQGSPPGKMGETVLLDIIDQGNQQPADYLRLEAEIVRVEKESFGLRVMQMTQDDRESWFELVISAASADFTKSVRPQLIDLPMDLQAEFAVGGLHHTGSITALSVDQCLLRINKSLKDAGENFTLSFTLPLQPPKVLNVDVVVSEQRRDEYLLSFINPSGDVVTEILNFLWSSVEARDEEKKEKEEEPTKAIAERVVIDNYRDLRKYMPGNFDGKTILLNSSNSHGVGDVIPLTIAVKAKQEGRKGKRLAVKLAGVVKRKTEQGVVVDLSSNLPQKIEALKQSLNLIRREHFEDKVSSASPDKVKQHTSAVAKWAALAMVVVGSLFWIDLGSLFNKPSSDIPIHQTGSGNLIVYAYDLKLQDKEIIKSVNPKRSFFLKDIHSVHYYTSMNQTTLHMLNGDKIIVTEDLFHQFPRSLINAIASLNSDNREVISN